MTSYKIWLRAAVHRGRRRLPGNVRQRVQRLIDGLSREPRPPNSKALKLPASAPQDILEAWEVRRARLDDWRVVYAVSESDRQIAVLLVARRPPYSYEDLQALLAELED